MCGCKVAGCVESCILAGCMDAACMGGCMGCCILAGWPGGYMLDGCIVAGTGCCSHRDGNDLHHSVRHRLAACGNLIVSHAATVAVA